MPQIQLPIFPEGVTHITPRARVQRAGWSGDLLQWIHAGVRPRGSGPGFGVVKLTGKCTAITLHRTSGTGNRRPHSERSVAEQSMILRAHQVAAISKQVTDATMESKKSLRLAHRFEALHLSFPAARMLM